MEKRKWDGSLSSVWTGARLAEGDPEALMWVLPIGAMRERPSTAERHEVDTPEAFAGGREWWVARAIAAPGGGVATILIDAAVPAALCGAGIVFVDLDLDLELTSSGDVLRDVAQFRERAERLGYPDDVRRSAWQGLADAAHRADRGVWPFDGALERYLIP